MLCGTRGIEKIKKNRQGGGGGAGAKGGEAGGKPKIVTLSFVWRKRSSEVVGKEERGHSWAL